jgi:CHAT domain-containing protein/Tfp pilus assembly protein PilF
MTKNAFFAKNRITQTFVFSLIFTFAVLAQDSKSDEPQELPPNKTIERHLSGAETHSYKINLKKDEIFQATVEQKGVDVILRLKDSGNVILAEIDSPNGTQGFEQLAYVADMDGNFTFEVASFEASAKGIYFVRRESSKVATKEERILIEAHRTTMEANLSYAKNTAESLQAAAAKFARARILYQRVGNKQNEGYSLLWLGNTMRMLNENQKSLDFYHQALPLIKESGDKKTEIGIYNNIGQILSNIGENKKSLEYLNQAIALCQTICDKREEAYILFSIGGVYQRLSEYQKSLELLNAALPVISASGDAMTEAIILAMLGSITSQTGDKQKARSFYEQALSIHRKLGTLNFTPPLLLGIGEIYRQSSEMEKALEYSSQALSEAQKTRNKAAEAMALNNSAVIYGDLGQYEKAIDFFNRSLAINKSLGDKNNLAVTLGSIGNMYNNLGDFKKAIEYLNQSLFILQTTGDKSNEANTLMNLGGLYDKLNDKEKTLEHLKKALSLQRTIGDKTREAITLSNLVTYYSSEKNSQKVKEYSDEALFLVRQLGNRRSEALIHHSLGSFYYELGDKSKSLDYFNQALNIRKNIGDKGGEAHTLNNIGYVYLQTGEIGKSLEYLSQSALLWKALGNKYGEAKTFSNFMLIGEKLNNQRLAILYGKQSVNIIQSLRANIKTLDKELQKSFLGSVESTYRKLAELLIKAGRLPEAEQVLAMLKEEEYFEFVRRDGDLAKALDKRISLSPSEKEALETYDKIAGEITALGVEFDKLEAEKNNRATSDARRKQILAQQNELDKKLETARVALNKFLEVLKNEFGKNDARVAAVESGLQKDVERLKEPQTVVISTIVGKENLSLIVTTSRAQTAHVVPISEEKLNLLVAEFRAAIMDSRSEKWREPAQQLYDVLIKPLQKDLDGVRARTLVWSLDGMLRYAPIAALWDKDRGFLVQRYANAVITLASRNDLAQRSDGKARWQALGVGVSKPFAEFSALTYVPEELSGIVRDPIAEPKEKQFGILNGRRLLDEDFTFDNFRLHLGRYPVVHAATHFSFVPGTRAESLNSFLLLGNGEKLTLGQMQKTGTIFSGVELLALSACDTAYGGRDADGREIENFGAMAQNKGAKSVLASLWRVADASTRDLMINFYSFYQKPNMTKAESLRQSQLVLLGHSDKTLNRKSPTSGTKKYAHPYFWSPFVLIGNWR